MLDVENCDLTVFLGLYKGRVTRRLCIQQVFGVRIRAYIAEFDDHIITGPILTITRLF